MFDVGFAIEKFLETGKGRADVGLETSVGTVAFEFEERVTSKVSVLIVKSLDELLEILIFLRFGVGKSKQLRCCGRRWGCSNLRSCGFGNGGFGDVGCCGGLSHRGEFRIRTLDGRRRWGSIS